MPMLRVIAEREHYLLVSDGQYFTVVERRAGKYYPLRNGIREGFDLHEDAVGELLRQSILFSERDAHRLLMQVATQWRDLLEHVR
jgi:hypothetical protein